MAVEIKHKFVSAIPDSGDTTIVQPSNWNDDHDLTGLGTMAEQDADAVDITGGTIDGVDIGDATPAQGTFTDVYVEEALTTDQITPLTTDGVIITNNTGVDTIASFGVGLSKNAVISPAGGDVTIAPTGAGKTTINSGAVGSIDNVNIGATTPATGKFTTATVASGSTTTILANNVGGPAYISTSTTNPDDAAILFIVNNSTDLTIDGDTFPKGGTVGQTSGFIRIPSAAGNAGTPSASVPHTAPMFFNESTNTLNVYNPSTSTWMPYVTGALTYAGTWNASTNTPTLTSSVGTTGNFYIVSVAGTTNLNGVTDWQVGDWAVFNGSAWQKVDNTDAVVSVNGQTGAVTITLSGLGAGTIATQNANNVAITGGAIDGTPIGNTTRSTGKFTSVDLNDKASLTWDGGENYISGEVGSGISIGANGITTIVQTDPTYGGPANIVRVDQYGSVGLGTVTVNPFGLPYRVLSMDAADGSIIDMRDNGTSQMILAATDGHAAIVSSTDLSFVTAGDQRLQFNADGSWVVGSGVGTAGQVLTSNGTGAEPSWQTNAGGDVVGPASSTDNAIARFDSTTGKLLQDSVVLVGDTGAVTGVTTLSASTSVSTPIVKATSSAGGALQNSSGTAQLQWGAGGGNNLTVDVAININPANAQVAISPTGTGSVTINPATAGTMNNMVIGGTTPLAGSFTNLSISGTTKFDGSEGTAGQVLTSAGTGNTPTWTTPTTGTVTSVTGTAPVVSSGGATPAISMAAAGGSTDGYLKGSDWTTFNNKANAFTYTAGYIPFGQGTTTPNQSANLFWDNTNGRLGVGTSSPAKSLDVRQAYTSDTTVAQIGNINNGNGATPVATMFDFTEANGTPVARISSIYTQSVGTTSLTFGTYGSGALSERMRIDSSGNVGINTTSNLGTLGKVVINAGGSLAGAAIYSTNQASLRFASAAATGGFLIGRSFSSDDAQNLFIYDVASAAARMFINSSGNVGIGTTNPAYKLAVQDSLAAGQVWSASQNTSSTSGSSAGFIGIATGTNNYFTLTTNNANNQTSLYSFGDGGLNLAVFAAQPMYFLTNNTERMRIDASGNLLVGRTANSTGNAAKIAISFSQNGITFTPTANDKYPCVFENASGTTVGYIFTSSTATTYSTTSDYRLKENVAPITGALNKVAQLKPCTYKWKADGSDGQGFIAHELQSVVPECVTGEKDAVDDKGKPKYQGIDTSFLVATLTAAIQELKIELDSVKAELQTLKGS